jgi:hypothetical protein
MGEGEEGENSKGKSRPRARCLAYGLKGETASRGFAEGWGG